MAKYVDSYKNLPKKKGKVALQAKIQNNEVFGAIVGDSKGLRYLADLLCYMADIEIGERKMPDGARAHFVLHPGLQLAKRSCGVELCRAEAKGTDEYPECFDE